MWTIIRKEITELWRDGRLKFSSIIILALLFFAAIAGVKQYQQTNAAYEHARVTERDIWESQGDKNPHSAAHYGTYAFKPKFALSLLDNGVNQFTGNSIFLEAHNRNEAAYSEATDQTGLARFGNLSISFMLLHLFPLLILLFGYNAFTREREMDTLRLLKSQHIQPMKLITGKWLATFLPIMLITIIIFLLMGLILSSTEEFAYFNWSSLGTMLATYLLYYAIITSITLLISMWSKSSGMALVASLSLWILFGFITPKIATNLANNLHPYPSKQDFYAAIKKDKKDGLDGHNPWSKEAKELKIRTLKEYGVEKVEELPFNYDAYRMQKGEEHESRVYKKHYEQLKQVFKKQNSVYQQVATISPFLPLRLLSMDIANTSYIAHWNFSDAAEDYRIEKQKFLNNNFRDNSKTGEWDYKMSSEGFKQLPQFTYSPPALGSILNENGLNFLILLIWLALPLCFIIFSAKKL